MEPLDGKLTVIVKKDANGSWLSLNIDRKDLDTLSAIAVCEIVKADLMKAVSDATKTQSIKQE